MKHSLYPSLSAFALVLGTLTLVGCGGAASFSNSKVVDTPPPVTPQSVPGPAVNGSVYGGHAPLEGAHVYLLQPGTTGYGSTATSLLGSGTTTSPGGYALAADTSDPNVPIGSMYVTSDVNGAFSFTGAYKCTVGEPVYVYAWGGNIGSGALNNKSIVQLATLGNCPSSGNFSTAGNGALQYVYLNEVSTIATAYTFQPFTLVTGNSAWDIGSSNTTQGLLGIANAADTAAQLYDIQGGTQITTPADGEGHLANFQTILGGVPNQGNGIVPQATIDTLANIVASCVDSPVTAVGTTTSQCTSLFTVARDNGETTGTQPIDTGTAAINIARFPAGNNSSTSVDATYARDIFAAQGSGTVPYVPKLSNAPNDWTIAINYPNNAVTGYPTATNTTLGAAESIAVDNLGQIWVTAQTGFFINRFSHLGVRNSLNTLTYIPGYVSVDGSNNAWTGNANCGPGNTSGCTTGTPIFEAGSNGVFSTTFGSGYEKAYTVITDKSDDVFFFAQNSTTTPNYDMWEYASGGTLTANSPIDLAPVTTTTTGTEPITITAATETHTGGGHPTYTYTFNFTTAGTPPAVIAVGDTVTLALTNAPAGFLGAAATGWQNLTSVTVATVNGAHTTFTATGTTVTTNSSGIGGGNGATGTGSYAYSITTTTPGVIPSGQDVAHGAIDSAGDLWITAENTGNTIARVTPTGTSVFTPIATAEQPEFPAIDNSNNAWIAVQATPSLIYQVTPTGSTTILTSAGAGGTVATGALVTSTFGAAVDGNGNIWFANRDGNYGAASGTTAAGVNTLFVINGGVSTPGTVNNAISPPTNYVPEAQYPATATTFTKMLNDSLNVAIDPSGNVWVTNYLGSAVVEVVGAAAPVVTPLSVAAGNSQLGQKP